MLELYVCRMYCMPRNIYACVVCVHHLVSSRGPDDQQTAIAKRVWSLLDEMTVEGRSVVPGHADIAGNEKADELANQAAENCDQRHPDRSVERQNRHPRLDDGPH